MRGRLKLLGASMLRRRRLSLSCASLLLAGVLLLLTPPLRAQFFDPLRGAVETPGFISVATKTKEYQFKARAAVNSPLQTAPGVIAEVLMLGSRAKPGQDNQWLYRSDARLYSSRDPFHFYTVDEPLFVDYPGSPNADTWPEGGTARVRLLATTLYPPGGQPLAVKDSDGVPAPLPEIILADTAPTPAALLRTPNYLNASGANFTAAETTRYYDTVRTGPDGQGPTIRESIGTLEKFKNRYFGGPQTPCFVLTESATYFNNYDLGLGRRMHCSLSFCPDPSFPVPEVACYVDNFGGKERQFDNFEGSYEPIGDGAPPLATVAMVERRKMAADAPNKVFFVVYDSTGSLGTSLALDTKGYNKFVPGNCLVCHGGGRYSATTHSASGGRFLPFDLSSFRFYDAIPGAPPELSRAAQESAFKFMNGLVGITDLVQDNKGQVTNEDAKILIEGWYGGGPGMPREAFDDDFVPPKWGGGAELNQRQLYRYVIAPTCRSCHISQPLPRRRWGSFESFSNYAEIIWELTCAPGNARVQPGVIAMPNAEQSLKTFWRTQARPQLLSRLEISSLGCGLPTP